MSPMRNHWPGEAVNNRAATVKERMPLGTHRHPLLHSRGSLCSASAGRSVSTVVPSQISGSTPHSVTPPGQTLCVFLSALRVSAVNTQPLIYRDRQGVPHA
jgi:hypothetical protein